MHYMLHCNSSPMLNLLRTLIRSPLQMNDSFGELTLRRRLHDDGSPKKNSKLDTQKKKKKPFGNLQVSCDAQE